MVEHLLERRRRVVVKIWGGPADAAQLRRVHHPNIRRLPREQHAARVGGRDELEGAIAERDAVGAGVAREPGWAGGEAVCGRARARSQDAGIALDGPNATDGCVRCGRARV